MSYMLEYQVIPWEKWFSLHDRRVADLKKAIWANLTNQRFKEVIV
ncbi:hypothetical protein TUMEXPCC7403_13770 [Tumidithrix helvetica PCC 7403]